MNFSKILIHWYSNNKRDLPWRKTKDPYRIWLSEIILQQTQVVQGLPYYISFLKHYPTVFDLANADENDVLKLWQGLGYYSRARNLHTTAKYVVNEFNGTFPNSYKELLKLKGVGDYTASAIASICFNEPAAVVDGNVYRVISRYFGIDTPINSSMGQKEFKTLAQKIIDRDNPATYNQAIMEFGAIQCKPQNPDCEICPLQNSCVALQKNIIKDLPVKLKANKVKKKFFNFLVFQSENGNTILEQRKAKGIWQNLYQFPLLETNQGVAEPFIAEYASNKVSNINKVKSVSEFYEDIIIHKLSHQHLYTKFWIVQVDKILESKISNKEIHKYPVPILIGNFIDDFDF